MFNYFKFRQLLCLNPHSREARPPATNILPAMISIFNCDFAHCRGCVSAGDTPRPDSHWASPFFCKLSAAAFPLCRGDYHRRITDGRRSHRREKFASHLGGSRLTFARHQPELVTDLESLLQPHDKELIAARRQMPFSTCQKHLRSGLGPRAKINQASSRIPGARFHSISRPSRKK